MMIKRSEIERLLNQTGRTLEGVPKDYSLAELLVGALKEALDKQPKWISVEERLPENGELVLITMSGDLDGRKHFIRAYELAMHWTKGEDDDEVYNNEGWELWDYEERRVNSFKVFHWMPLPEPPKEENV